MIPIKTERTGRPSKRPSEEVLAREYEEHTAKEIAEKYGVAVSTVRRWISEYRKEYKEWQKKAKQ